jgi:hypothetical protein
MKYTSCSKCGADGPAAQAYCMRCGEWLPNCDGNLSSDLLVQRTREHLRYIRFLQTMGAGLSLVAAAVITIVLVTDRDTPLLFLGVLCCLVVAIYQLMTLCQSYTVQELLNRSRFRKIDTINIPAKESDKLGPTFRTLLVYRWRLSGKTTSNGSDQYTQPRSRVRNARPSA